MRRRPLVLPGALIIVAVVSLGLVPFVHAQPVGAAAPQAEAESWTSRTPWGDPDLQGVWASDSATPLERPGPLADREFLTDEEVALLKQRAAELFNGETDAAFGDSVYEAVLNEANDFNSSDTTGNYNQFWLIDRWFENRTSLIVDPPDGRIPPSRPRGRRDRRPPPRDETVTEGDRVCLAAGRLQCGAALHRRSSAHDGEGVQQQLSDRTVSAVRRDQHGDDAR